MIHYSPVIMNTIANALQAVHMRIERAAGTAGRPAGAVRLLAVSKTFGADAVRQACLAGQTAFGENYLQEALVKQRALADLPLEWHFIGPIQSNKTRQIAQHFSWVHSVEREKIAERLNEQRDVHLPPLNVLVQVNVSGEASKSGIAPDMALQLAHRIAAMPHLRLRGLMAIPAPAADEAAQRAPFRLLKQIFDAGLQQGLQWDTLSMGMSHDLEAAILEGATLVRVGTAIFGARDYGENDR